MSLAHPCRGWRVAKPAVSWRSLWADPVLFMETLTGFSGSYMRPRPTRLTPDQRIAIRKVVSDRARGTMLTVERGSGCTSILAALALWYLVRPRGGSVDFITRSSQEIGAVKQLLERHFRSGLWPRSLAERIGSWPDGLDFDRGDERRFLRVRSAKDNGLAHGDVLCCVICDLGLLDGVNQFMTNRADRLIVARPSARSFGWRDVPLPRRGVRRRERAAGRGLRHPDVPTIPWRARKEGDRG